jgi:hypothetical protein
MNPRIQTFLLSFILLALTACAPLTRPPSASDLPPAIEYNLGEATIVQAHFAADSRFRHMPVRLNGIIAAPTEGNGPYPVVLIFHGNHPGCPNGF